MWRIICRSLWTNDWRRSFSVSPSLRNTGGFPTISWHTPSHTTGSGSRINVYDESLLPSNWRLRQMGDICQIPQNCFPVSDWSPWLRSLVKRWREVCRPCHETPFLPIARFLPVSILKTESMVFAFNLCIFSTSRKMEKYEVDIPKAVLIFLPIVFSQASGSAAALDLLEAGSFSFHPELRKRFPQENWDQLFSSSYTACTLAIATGGDMPEQTIREPRAKPEIGRSSKGSGCRSMLRRLKGLFKSSKS